VARLVAISATYGAGGSWVGPRVAERLGVPFLDRAIPVAVANRLQVPVEVAEGFDDRAEGSLLARLLSSFRAADVTVPTALPDEGPLAEDFRLATERVLFEQVEKGEGVILGRASAYLLRKTAGVLRVRLDGPREERIRQAMALEGIAEEEALRRLERVDRAHAAYAYLHYRAKMADPALYHLYLDSTALPLERCVELVVAAAEALPEGAPERDVQGWRGSGSPRRG
jgi:hypothetical protein